MKEREKNYLKWLPLILILVFLSFSYAQKIDLTNSDIGRHIKNGELFIEEGKIISTNFYSYTEKDYSLVTHHWAYGPFVYSIWKLGGFKLLSIINILFCLLTFILFFSIAKEKGNHKLAILLSVVLIPLIILRKGIRPEIISYFLLAIYYFLLTKFKDKKINYKKLLWILIPLQIIWVNTHLFFIFGISIISFFTIDSFINKKEDLKKYLILLGSIIVVSLVNPHFLKGLLEPLLIFKEYGYLIAENMGVIFMQKRNFSHIYLFFEFLFLLGFISFFISKKSFKKNILNILLFIFFGILAWKMIRNLAIFGLILIPILSENLKGIYDKIKNKKQIKKILISSLIIFIFILGGLNYFSMNSGKGIGLIETNQNSFKFFKENNLEGPIFNNYDLGSYIIFNLFPQEKVFVDNRPEAYSTNFFENIYVPMQEDEETWKEYEKKYNLNIIYFNRHDLTPWAQKFLIERIKDSEWIPVYVDNFTIIYLKNDEKNREIIEKFELPKKIFTIN
ncbi:MAG: hypothetical protein U9Q99_02695 [Nanoarchaeota archaeon]|nr:hypothetical protein [Nanoarchaeota archaeon]